MKIFGHVDNVHELMAVSDAMVTKPGGPSIAEALVNTAGGLGVAIVAIISYNYFLSRIDKMNFMIEESSSELISLLLIRESKAN